MQKRHYPRHFCSWNLHLLQSPNIRFVALIKEPAPSVVVVIFVVVRVIRRFPHRFAVVHTIPEFVLDSLWYAVGLGYPMTHWPWTRIGNIFYHFPTESFFHESTFSWLQHLVNGLDWFSNCYSRKKTFQHSYIVKWGASSQWLFRPSSAWGSIETTTIAKTHPSLEVI